MAIAAAAGGFVSAISAISAVASAVGGILLMPIVAIPAALAVAGAAFLAFTDTGRGLVSDLGDAIREMFSDTVANVMDSWKAVVGAIGRGDFEMAFKIGTGAIKTEWLRLTLWLTDYWNKFKDTFLDGWRNVVQKFTDIWAAGVDSTASSLVWLLEKFRFVTKEEAAGIQAQLNDMSKEEAAARTKSRIDKARGDKEAREKDLEDARKDLRDAEAEQKDLLRQNAELQQAADAAEAARHRASRTTRTSPAPWRRRAGGARCVRRQRQPRPVLRRRRPGHRGQDPRRVEDADGHPAQDPRRRHRFDRPCLCRG